MSLRTRTALLWIVAVAAVQVLCASIYVELRRAQADAEWVERTQEVVLRVAEIQGSVDVAETAQRGFLLTRREAYLAQLDPALEHNAGSFRRANELVVNPGQKDRLSKLAKLVETKFAELRETVDLGRKGDFEAALALVQGDRGLNTMARIRQSVAEIQAVQQQLLETRSESARTRTRGIFATILGGGLVVVVTMLALGLTTMRRLNRPLEQLVEGTRLLGAGASGHRIAVRSDDELGRLAHAINAMADQQAAALVAREAADQQILEANEALSRKTDELVARGRAIETLSRMAQRLQSAGGDGEFGQVAARLVPEILPDRAGALFAVNHSRNLFVRIAAWGDPNLPTEFQPQDCWALRRGQSHHRGDDYGEVDCQHFAGTPASCYHCLPLTAASDVVGLLYLQGELSPVERDAAGALVESVALALVNHRLRASLREQSIRDPLTRLFNRRYMEETLALEFARAERTGGEIAVIMMDIDHFKRFNDSFGHEAGDAMLQAVARMVLARVRKGDIACRYGGEELIVVLPGVGLDGALERAGGILAGARELSIVHEGRSLGHVTLSLGVAAAKADTTSAPALIALADRALYGAKAAGRDRIEHSGAEPVPA
ncbi:sensor domain-containing diguanylate cyclase [Arenibaculum pallidiluteum]|uniref:sensor domain-containing diguanylate cyclase n=1 Tax=Arenibaculum pallidiluteum TaxID=2812559 RepID=UPI001A962756|nr:diguanylate cyclase [Arenibaculum pallidiluteum]